MIKITKSEMEYMKTRGCKFPTDLHKTYSGNRGDHYYLTESFRNLNILKAFRERNTHKA